MQIIKCIGKTCLHFNAVLKRMIAVRSAWCRILFLVRRTADTFSVSGAFCFICVSKIRSTWSVRCVRSTSTLPLFDLWRFSPHVLEWRREWRLPWSWSFVALIASTLSPCSTLACTTISLLAYRTRMPLSKTSSFAICSWTLPFTRSLASRRSCSSCARRRARWTVLARFFSKASWCWCAINCKRVCLPSPPRVSRLISNPFLWTASSANRQKSPSQIFCTTTRSRRTSPITSSRCLSSVFARSTVDWAAFRPSSLRRFFRSRTSSCLPIIREGMQCCITCLPTRSCTMWSWTCARLFQAVSRPPCLRVSNDASRLERRRNSRWSERRVESK